MTLGCYLLDAQTLLVSDLKAHEFNVPKHRAAYGAMRSLCESGEAINSVAVVSEALRREGKTAQQLEVAYLNGLLTDVQENYIAVAQVRTYERHIRDAAERRALFHDLSKAASAVMDETQDIGAVKDQVQNIALRQGEDSNRAYLEGGSAAARDVFEYLERVEHVQGGLLGLSTGLTGLDDLTGGLQRGQLIILGAATGGGKTTLALQFARHALLKVKKPVPVYYASLEMSRAQCTLKIASGIARVNDQEYRKRPNPADRAKLTPVLEKIHQSPLHCDDTSSMSLAQIRSRALQVHYRTGGLGLIVVDYLQMMTSEGNRQENRTVEVGRFANGLKALARELDVPVVALAQINRASQQRADKRPTLGDLRE